MPKSDLILNPGDDLPPELAAVLHRRFSADRLAKLHGVGGLVRISLAAPYAAAKHADLVMDEAAVERLRTVADDPDKLEKQLRGFTTKQLFEIGRLFEMPLPKSGKQAELIAYIKTRLGSKARWDGIAGMTVRED